MSKYQLELVRRKNHLCIICEKPAEPRGDKGFWPKCPECRAQAAAAGKAAAEKSEQFKQTLCWRCKNSVPDLKGKQGCNWSRKKKPVDGWEAIPTKLKVANGVTVPSFHVEKCPEFVEG